jgi:hypothetical protein
METFFEYEGPIRMETRFEEPQVNELRGPAFAPKESRAMPFNLDFYLARRGLKRSDLELPDDLRKTLQLEFHQHWARKKMLDVRLCWVFNSTGVH